MLPPQQIWIKAFPTLAGAVVAISSLGTGGSLLQAGAAGLATGMTGYVASALSVEEARARVRLLEQSLDHQNQNKVNALILQQLQKALTDLQVTLHLQQDQQNPERKPKPIELASEIESQRQLLITLQEEEQTLRNSVQDLQTKRQKLIECLKESLATVEQLQKKRNHLRQDILRLAKTQQPTSHAGNSVVTQALHHPTQLNSKVNLEALHSTGIPKTVQSGSKYDAILSDIERKIDDLQNRAKATSDLISI
ncbi:MAG: hypothetical protein Q6K80_03560 [Thermostichus sp. DG_1_6_bins_120]